MLTALVWLIVYFAVAALFYWAATTILRLFNIPEPARTIINVLIVVIAVIIALYALAGFVGSLGGAPHLLR